jgi:phosphoribosylamine-glycine ligase
MKKILINSNRIHGSALAKKLAEDNPQIHVDLIGAPIQGDLPQNLFQLGDNVAWHDRFENLKRNADEYDFIYAADMTFQLSEDFQNWRSTTDIPILCPEKKCGLLEFSKSLTKKVLSALRIPTPSYQILKMSEWGDYDKIEHRFVDAKKFMLKLDKSFISTGRQTMITDRTNYKKFMEWHFRQGHTGDYVVEEFLEGRELSCHFLCNGTDWIYLGSARDYKKEFENDSGQNCSSAGSYSFDNILENNIKEKICTYVDKILFYLREKSILFKGILYLGILIDDKNIPNILEINCRSGNPEFNVILETIQSTNLLENLLAASIGKELSDIEFNTNKVVSVNLLNKNYLNPQSSDKNIFLPFDSELIVTYFFPTEAYFNKLYCNVLAKSDSIESSSNKIFKYLDQQSLEHYRFRKDIGMLK